MTIAPAESTAEVAVVQQPQKVAVPLLGQLADLDQAWRLAQALSLADILPKDLRGKPSNVLLTILYGQQLNIPPVIAIQTISVVKGRPQMAGKLLLAKVREAGHRAEITEHTDRLCTVKITRGDTGEIHSETFTLDDAVAANLVKIKDGKPHARSQGGEPLPWESWTRRMLLWRAAGFCADFICPEVRMGFAIEGEMDVLPPERPTLAQVAAEREDKPAVELAHDAEAVRVEVAQLADEFAPAGEQAPIPVDELPEQAISKPQVGRIRELFTACRVESSPDRNAVIAEIIGHPVGSIASLTRPQGVAVVAALEKCAQADDPALALGELRQDLLAAAEMEQE